MTCSALADCDSDLQARIASLLGQPLGALTHITGGGNSRVYRVETPDGPRAVKLYPAGGEKRDRLDAETTAIAFMVRNGMDNVPSLVTFDRLRNMAVFVWLDGRPVDMAGPAEIDAALEFLHALHGLRTAPGASDLPLAAEACLSVAELVGQIERRRDRLLATAGAPHDFLKDEVEPTLAAAAAMAGRTGAAAVLPVPVRTLSPSDFGFHNALRRPDGRLAFLDFEYFGWDDPAKLTADVLLHPGMRLTDAAKARFADGARMLYGRDDPGFADRLAVTMPLYALRWCMIVLNEFLPERWAQRIRAGVDVERPAVLDRQLTKARGFLVSARTLLNGASA